MIPFDLTQFDEVEKEGQTAVTIEAIAKRNLTNSGVVRESAAILLSHLYVRYKNIHIQWFIVQSQRVSGGMRWLAFQRLWLWPKPALKNRTISLRYIHFGYTMATHSVPFPVSRCLSHALRGRQEQPIRCSFAIYPRFLRGCAGTRVQLYSLQ